MKQYILSIVLMSMLIPAAAFCQEFEHEDVDIQMEMREREMELKNREAEMGREQEMGMLDLQHREAQMGLEREMREVELERRRFELERAQAQEGDKDELLPLLLLVLVVHILMAVWVYTDIRQRNCGSGIWIVIALLAGLLGTLVYAVVRIGDNRKKEP